MTDLAHFQHGRAAMDSDRRAQNGEILMRIRAETLRRTHSGKLCGPTDEIDRTVIALPAFTAFPVLEKYFEKVNPMAAMQSALH